MEVWRETPNETLLQKKTTLRDGMSGTLFVTSERVVWVNTSTNAVSVKFSHLAIEKILYSGPTSAKVKLQINLHGGGKESFVLPGELTIARVDLDVIKDLLLKLQAQAIEKQNTLKKQRLAQEAASKTSTLSNQASTASDISASTTATTATTATSTTSSQVKQTTTTSTSKTAAPSFASSSTTPTTTASLISNQHNFESKAFREEFLTKHPHIKQSFLDLVVNDKLTETEFWSSIKQDFTTDSSLQQNMGVLTGYRSIFRGEVVNKEKVTYTLTVEIIQSIFKLFPSIAKEYKDTVPPRSEEDFWQSALKSAELASKIATHNDPINDIMIKAKNDPNKRLKITWDPLTDITVDEAVDDDDVLELNKDGSGMSFIEKAKKRRELLSSINRESTRIMSSMEHGASTTSNNDNTDAQFQEREEKLRKSVEFNDLETHTTQHFAPLKISRSDFQSKLAKTPSQLQQQLQQQQRQPESYVIVEGMPVLSVMFHKHSLLSSSSSSSSTDTKVPKDISDEICRIYRSTSELIRHTLSKLKTNPKANTENAKILQRHGQHLQNEYKNLTEVLRPKFGEHHHSLDGLENSLKSTIERYENWAKRTAPKPV